MYLMYIDESGDTAPISKEGKKFLVLSGCIIHDTDRVGIETQSRTTFVECITAQAGQLAGERTQRGAQLGRAAGVLAAPERQPGRLARCGNHQHPVVGDLGDPPTGGAQRDDVAGA